MPAHTVNDGLSEASYIKLHNAIHGMSLYEATEKMRRYLRIPNAKRRSELRKIHTHLDKISRNLSSVFDFAYARQEWMACDVVASIWIELCGDAILCHSLLEAGLLTRALRLVDLDGACMVLSLLSVLARQGDDTVKAAVLRGLSRIVVSWTDVWRSWPYSHEFVFIILHHCTAFDGGSHFPPELSVSVVADLALSALEDPAVSYETVIHAIPVLIACARLCSCGETDTRAQILDFLAVLLHSDDIAIRSVSAWVFYGLANAEWESLPPRRRQLRSFDYVHFPELALRDVPPGSELESIRTHTAMLHTILRTLFNDGDFYKFGLGMAHLLSNGRFVFNKDDFSEVEWSTLAEFDSWYSLLPGAAEALGKRSEPSHHDMADVLVLEHLVHTGPSEAAATRAREVLQRNAHHAYAFVILSENSHNLEEALQAARKGVQLAQLTVYLQRRLHVSAMKLSFAKGQTFVLRSALMDLRGRQIALESMHMTLEHFEMLIPIAPLDLHDLPSVLDMTIILMLIRQGNEYSPGFERLEPFWDHIERSKQTMERLGLELAEDPMRAGTKALAHHFSQGFTKWAAVVERFKLDRGTCPCTHTVNYPRPRSHYSTIQQWHPDSLPTDSNDSAGSCEDAFARWWEPRRPALVSIIQGPLRCNCYNYGGVQLSPGLPLMYACSWCSCRTGIVRECSRCEGAWYCNAQCQRAHWPQHKAECVNSNDN